MPGTLQEGGAPFQTTHWTIVLQAGKAEADEAAQKALAIFSETYWPPLYTFIRRRGYSPSNAQDIVQGFFEHLLERNTLSRADQEKGKLRTFLLGALQNFLLKQHERMNALKRGGGKQMVSLDDQIIDAEAAMHATMHLNEVSSYDAAWASSIVARSWKSIRERFVAEGKGEWFDALRPFVAGGTAQPPGQQEVAERLGTTVENLRVSVSRLRQRYRHALRAEVASTVSDPKEIDDELHLSLPGPDLMSAVEDAVRVCATCGQAMTHVGPDGECMRCLVSFGFLSDEQQSEEDKSNKPARPGPLRYAHFEVEVNADGFPKILGSGAMAVTYCARDTILNSTIALKVISRKLAADPTARARFLREARAAAQIQHPNVARVIHYGEQDGECFYAMELVHGETLEERVQRDGPLPLSLALEVVEQTARGLAAGEACGVIHRDLKPSNLMTESDPTGHMLVKIIDYGVAKVMVSDPTLQTQAGFIGTPAFASPEQFNELGQQQVDTRSDIYSLGIVLWYLLTGQTPFAGQSLEQVRAKQKQQLPLEQLKNAHVPHECVTFLKSMLALDPAKRPQTARELLAKIHRCWLRFEPAARRRRKRLVIAATGLALALAILLVTRIVYQRSYSSSALDRSIAVLPFENLSSNADDRFLAIGIQDEILTKLASLADLKVIARTSTQGYQSRPVDLRTVGRQLNVGRVLEGSLQRSADKIRVNVQLIDTRSNAHLWASSYDRKLDDVFAVETEIANTIAQQLDAKLVQRISTKRPTANSAAYNAYLRGLGIEHSQSSGGLSYEDSATAYAEAVQLDPNFGLAWARLSIVRSFLYYHGVDPNVNSAAAVKETADRALALAPELGEAWLAQGTYRSRVLNDPAAALQAYREAERRLPNGALVREYMAYAERRLDRWREAEAHLVRAIELDPGNTRLWTNLASDILWPLGRAAEAHAAYDRALEISPNNEFVIALKAAQYQHEGRLGEAAKELARIPRDSTDKAVLIHRVDQAVLERNFDEAIYWAKKATSSPSPGQAHNTQDIFALVLQGYCELWASHREDARTTFERVIHEVAPGGVLRTPPILGSRIYLAVAYAGLGDKSNAHEQARQAVAEYKNDALLKPIAEAFRARALAQLGEVDAAIDALPHLLEVPGGIHPGDLRYSPYWDPLRNNPRFEELLKNPPPVRY